MSNSDAANETSVTRDVAWMRRIALGDRAALGELMREHQGRVLQTAYRFLGNWDAAEDIVQETFLRVHRAASSYQPQAAFTTWLYRLVVNLCWDQRRRAARERRLRLNAPPPAEIAEPADAEQQERAARVRDAVLALPDRQRLAVVLHRFEGYSHREIAETTGWSIGAVESCLVRAYAALRQALREYGS